MLKRPIDAVAVDRVEGGALRRSQGHSGALEQGNARSGEASKEGLRPPLLMDLGALPVSWIWFHGPIVFDPSSVQ